MRIRVDEIPDSGRFLHIHWDESRLSQFIPPDDPFELHLVRPLNVDLEISKRTDHIRIEGTIEGVLLVSCHRCLETFDWFLKEPVDVFLTEDKQTPDEEEVQLEPEDLDYEFFDGEAIEIDQLIAEQIFLSLPVKILCSETCRGLCPHCGANLNHEPCKCKRAAKDSPFSKLETLKAQLP